nr:hypothetical protein [uncultured Dongia sp.]
MTDPTRVEINIPETSPRCIVRTETIAGSAVPGIPFRFMNPGESEPFMIEADQRLVIMAHPEKVET